MGLFSSKLKYKIILLRKQNDVYRIEKIIRKNSIKKMVGTEGKRFVINPSKPSYVHNKWVVYLVDIDNGNQIVFDKLKNDIRPEDLDLIVGQNILQQIAKGVMNNKKDMLMYMFLGLVLGGLIVAVILLGYFNGKIEELLSTGNYNAPDLPTLPINMIQLIKLMVR